MEQKQQLEDQLRAYTDKKRYKKRQIRELHEDLQVSQSAGETIFRWDNLQVSQSTSETMLRWVSLQVSQSTSEPMLKWANVCRLCFQLTWFSDFHLHVNRLFSPLLEDNQCCVSRICKLFRFAVTNNNDNKNSNGLWSYHHDTHCESSPCLSDYQLSDPANQHRLCIGCDTTGRLLSSTVHTFSFVWFIRLKIIFIFYA